MKRNNTYNIMLDMAFSLETRNDFESLTKKEIMKALHKRVDDLEENFEPEAFGFSDEYKVN